MAMWLVLVSLVGLVAGAVTASLVTAARSAARQAATALDHARAVGALERALTEERTAAAAERQAGAERQAAWEESRQLLAGEFAELSSAALTRSTTQFLELAQARLKETQQEAKGELDQRRQAIEQVVTPLREQLSKYEAVVQQLEVSRQGAYSSLTEQVRHLSDAQKQLQAETRNLVTALRAPATRGRWGEMQLRRVVEMAGMVEHCDFDEQVTATTDEGRMRPDMVVHLPGDRCVVVDAKVPLQAFLDANEAIDESSRRAHLHTHARHLRAHVDALAKKGYWQQFDRSPQFVVAFVPGEPLLSAALEHDPTLLEHAIANNVVFATPTNLIALLRTIAAGWQQEEVAENAREVQTIGRELYKRLCTFGDHLGKAGRGLAGAVDAYNKAVGSLEHSVLPKARRFQELGVIGTGAEPLAELAPIETTPRRPQPSELAGATPALELVVDVSEPPQLPGAADG
jgi:DNA recombination protein RmuC